MASNTLKRLAGPAFIANAAANIYSQNALIYDIVRHIHVANKTGTAATFSLYVGATGGSASGTELFGTVTVAANSTFDYYCVLRLAGAVDFLSGDAGTASALVITVEGESGVINR
jgi:hypothetical protein